jgi:hypothetical protein
MQPRIRPVRKVVSKKVWLEPLGTYPDGPPTIKVEKEVHALNLESFSSDILARVDALLVFSFFASKRKTRSKNAIFLDTVGPLECSIEQGQQISRLLNDKSCVSRTLPTRAQCVVLAERLLGSFPTIFHQHERRAIEQ